MNEYFDNDLEIDRERGYEDAIAGRKSTTRHAASVSAYSTGYEEGWEKRQQEIKARRIETLEKIRRGK